MASDPSMLRERLAYWIGRQIGGVATSRCNHAWVTMNGAPLGLYATVEEPKQELMARYFADATGPVYTIHYADFQPAYLSGFELQDGSNDLTLINGATAALADRRLRGDGRQEAFQQRRRGDVSAAGRLFHDRSGGIRRQVPGGTGGPAIPLTAPGVLTLGIHDRARAHWIDRQRSIQDLRRPLR